MGTCCSAFVGNEKVDLIHFLNERNLSSTRVINRIWMMIQDSKIENGPFEMQL